MALIPLKSDFLRSRKRFCFGLFVGVVLSFLFLGSGFAQTDSLSGKMSFDFGITRGKNINLFPLLVKYKSLERKEWQVLFPLFSKSVNYQIREKHLQLLPILKSDSTENGHDIRLLTLYYPSLFRFQRQVVNGDLVKSTRFLELAPNISLLAASRSAQGLVVENNMFFFIWYRRNAHLQTTNFTIFPIYWYSAVKDRESQLIFPIYYKRSFAGEKNLALGLLYNHKKTPTLKRQLFFPVYWNYQRINASDTAYSNTLFPVYWRREDQHEKQITVFPFFSKGTHQDKSESYLNIYPLYYSKTSKFSGYQIIVPFWWKNKTEKPGSLKENKVLFPLYFFSQRNNTDSTRFFFPVYYQKNSPGSVHIWSGLVYQYSHTPAYKAHTFFPIWWQKDRYLNHDTLKTRLLVPVYWSERDHNRNDQVLFPLFYSFRDSSYQSVTVLPFFSSGHSSDQSRKHAHVFPFYYSRQSPDRNSLTLFPIWWFSKTRLADGSPLIRNYLFPLFWNSHSKYEDRTTIFPVYFDVHNKDKELTLFVPFYLSGKRKDSPLNYRAITPVFWQWEKPTSKQTLLLPVLWKKESFFNGDTVRKTLVLPAYYSYRSDNESNKMVFPFLFSYRDTNYHSFTVLPLFSVGSAPNGTRRHLNVFPLYWSLYTTSSTTRAIFPFWLSRDVKQNGDTLKKRWVLPTFLSIQDRKRSNQMILPVFFRLRNEQRMVTTAFPFYTHFEHRQKRYNYWGVTPLFWKVNKPTGKSLVAFPILWLKEKYRFADTLKTEVVFPVYWASESKYHKSRTLFPFYHRSGNEQSQTFMLFPVYLNHSTYDGTKKFGSRLLLYWYNKNQQENTQIVFPLFWNTNRFFENGDTSLSRVFFPIYWRKKMPGFNRLTIFPLFHASNDSGSVSRMVFPLFYYWNIKGTPWNKMIIAPFVWHTNRPDLQRDIFFPIFWNSRQEESGKMVHKTVLFPIFWNTQSEHSEQQFILPVWLKSRDSVKTVTAVFPFYYSIRQNNTAWGRQIIFPIYWRVNEPAEKRQVIFPLFWKKEHFGAHDTIIRSTFFPIYWAKKTKAESERFVLPNFYSRHNNGDRKLVLFPLFSYGRSANGDSHHLTITPIAGAFYSPLGFKKYLFPIVSIKRIGELQSSSLFLFLFRREVEKDTVKTSVLWPIIAFNKSGHAKSFRIAPLIWSSRNDTTRMINVIPLYYSNVSTTQQVFNLGAVLYRYRKIEGHSVSRSLLWRVYYREKVNNGDFETRLLHWLYSNVKKEGRRERGLLPFYYKIDRPNGDRSYSYLLGLYNYYREYKPYVQDYYEEERILGFIRLRSNYEQLKKKGFVR